MSLNAHDRHALAQIEEELAGGDPKFAAKLSAFSRLADGEAMPESERIRQARRRVTVPAFRGLRRGQPGRPRLLLYWIVVALAVAVTLAVIGVSLVFGNTGSKGACTGWQTGACRTAHSAPPAPSGHHGHTTPLVP